MAIFRTLFALSWILLTASSLSAQTTWFIRANGNAGNDGLTEATAKRQIGDIPTAGGGTILAAGDQINIGAGDFAAATINVSVSIAGANAGNATYVVNAGAVINETTLGTITIGGADQAITIEGARWNAGNVPVVSNGATNAVVTVTNSHFDQAGAITATAAAGWKELYISGCEFDGTDGGTTSTNAIVATNLDMLDFSENRVRDYTASALTLTAKSGSTITVTYNEFFGNNTSSGSDDAAIVVTGHSGMTVGEVHNNVFTNDFNGVVVKDPVPSTLSVRYNQIMPNGLSRAIKNIGTSGPLVATCNNYGMGIPPSIIRTMFSGSVTVLPYNYEGEEETADQGVIGFKPKPNQQCATAGPVTTSTTEASGASYFTISEAITASASGATVKILNDSYAENLTINKRLNLLSFSDPDDKTPVDADTVNSGITRTSFVSIEGTITITSAADNVLLNGFEIIRPQNASATNVTLVTTNASKSTQIRNCRFSVQDGDNSPTSVPTNGVIHVVRAGDISLWQSMVEKPTTTGIRALTFAAGNGCREVNVRNCDIMGTIQLSGLSALSNVLIYNNLIRNAGVDGVSVTGNIVRTLNLTYNTIVNSNENGIAWRNGAAVGTDVANIKNNSITASGLSSATGTFAGINIGSLTTGTNHDYRDNSFDGQNTGVNFRNSRSGFNPQATCNWWGNISEDVIVGGLVGSVQYDNGTSGWRADGGSTLPGGVDNGYAPSTANCSVRTMTVTLNKTNISCNNANNGSLTAQVTLGGGTVSNYSWSGGPSGAGAATYSGLAAGTYSVTVTSSLGNIRSKTGQIYNPTAITASATPTNITCFYATDGIVTVSAVAGGVHTDAGTRTYNYALKLANTSTLSYGPQTSLTFSGIDAGTYDVFVTAIGSSNGSLINNPSCETLVREDIVVIRPNAFTSGAISSTGETICNAGTPAVTIGSTTPASGGDENITYSWRSSADGYTAAISGATAATYLPPAGLTTTTSYRRYAKDGRCNTTPEVSSGTWTVTVNNLTAGVVGTNQTICEGSDVAAFTVTTAATGDGTLSYQWERNTNLTTPSWSAISGATSDTYDEGTLTADAQYRRVTTSLLNGNSCTATSNTITVTVNNLTAGVVGTDQTICEGSDVAAFTVTTAATGDGTLSYQWERNTNLTTPSWSAISGATSDTYDEGTLTADAQYRRVTTSLLNGRSCTATSNTITVTVNNLTAGMVGSNQTICEGGDVAAFTVTTAATGDGTLSYQWERNTNLTTPSWSAISGATSDTYDEGALSADAQYRRVTTSLLNGNSCTATSNVITVTVNNLAAGSIGSSQTICYNGDPNGFTNAAAATGDGTITYRWESSTTSTTVGFAPISGATASTFDAGALTQTTHYRRVAISTLNGVACEAVSNAVTITVPSAQVAATVTKTHITCSNATNGTVTVSTPTGGYGTYETSIDGTDWFDVSTASSKQFAGLDAGTYTVTLRDKAYPTCQVTYERVIFRPSQLSVEFSVKHTSCGAADGVITLSNASGGTHPELPTQSYEYELQDDALLLTPVTQTSSVFAGLTGQMYRVTIRAVGVAPTCQRIYNLIRVEGNSPITADVAKTNISCANAGDGTITVTGATGGTSDIVTTRDYRYQIVNLGNNAVTGPQVSGTFTGLAAGTYGVDVIALATGSTPECIVRVATRQINNPSVVVSTTSKINISKNGIADGQISFASTAGGIHTGGDVTSRTYEYYVMRSGGGTTGPQASATFTGLSAGTYTTFVVALATGSTPACTTQVTSQTVLEPSVVTADIATVNISCAASGDGQITVSNAAGGTHSEIGTRSYTYRAARNGGGYDVTNGAGIFSSLSAGTYTVSVIAASAGSGTVPESSTEISSDVIIYEPTAVEASPISTVNPSCNGAANGSLNAQNATGGTHGAIGSRIYQYSISKLGVGGTTTGPQTSSLFTGLSAGTYDVFVVALAVANNPACTTNVGQRVLIHPMAVTHSIADNANTSAPYIRTGGVITFTITAQGGTPKTHTSPSSSEPHYNVTWSAKPSGITADPTFVSSTNSGGIYTMVYTVSGVDPDVASGTYSVTITDNNSCASISNGSGAASTVANVYSTVDIYVDNVNGSNTTGTGTSARPLSTITMAIDVAQNPTETINVMQNSTDPDGGGPTPGPTPINEGTDGPIITKTLTFKRVSFSYDPAGTPTRYSGITQLSEEVTFSGATAFVLGTSTVTFSGFAPTRLNVNNAGSIQEAIDEIVTMGGTVVLLSGSGGTYDLGAPLNISKAMTLTGSPTGTPTSACDLAPMTSLRVAGVTKMMIFTGTGVKVIRNLDLTVSCSALPAVVNNANGNTTNNTGRFFEVAQGSSGNVTPTNMIYRFDHDRNPATIGTRLFGITNDDRSGGVLYDVAKFVNDKTDGANFGAGEVKYGEQGPLPMSEELVSGWKAEDCGATTEVGVAQMFPMVGGITVRPQNSGARPVWRTTTNGLNGRPALEFNGTTQFLHSSATTGLIAGGAKTVMATFRTPNVDLTNLVPQVIYKHGDEKNGMSIVLVGTSVGTAINMQVRMNIYDFGTGTQRTVSRTFAAVKNTAYIAQMYFDGASTNKRVGMALDNADGQVGENVLGSGDFDVATLTATGLLSSATNVSIGSRSGAVRYSDGALDFNATAGFSNFFGGSGTASSTTSRIAEILVYNTASSSVRDAAYCYMRNKYLTSNSVNNGLEKTDPAGDVIAGDVELVDEVEAYPNPAETDVTVSVATRLAGNLRIEIVDALGRIVLPVFNEYVAEKTIIPVTVDVSGLPSGSYVVRAVGGAGLNLSHPLIIRR